MSFDLNAISLPTMRNNNISQRVMTCLHSSQTSYTCIKRPCIMHEAVLVFLALLFLFLMIGAFQENCGALSKACNTLKYQQRDKINSGHT